MTWNARRAALGFGRDGALRGGMQLSFAEWVSRPVASRPRYSLFRVFSGAEEATEPRKHVRWGLPTISLELGDCFRTCDEVSNIRAAELREVAYNLLLFLVWGQGYQVSQLSHPQLVESLHHGCLCPSACTSPSRASTAPRSLLFEIVVDQGGLPHVGWLASETVSTFQVQSRRALLRRGFGKRNRSSGHLHFFVDDARRRMLGVHHTDAVRNDWFASSSDSSDAWKEASFAANSRARMLLHICSVELNANLPKRLSPVACNRWRMEGLLILSMGLPHGTQSAKLLWDRLADDVQSMVRVVKVDAPPNWTIVLALTQCVWSAAFWSKHAPHNKSQSIRCNDRASQSLFEAIEEEASSTNLPHDVSLRATLSCCDEAVAACNCETSVVGQVIASWWRLARSLDGGLQSAPFNSDPPAAKVFDRLAVLLGLLMQTGGSQLVFLRASRDMAEVMVLVNHLVSLPGGIGIVLRKTIAPLNLTVAEALTDVADRMWRSLRCMKREAGMTTGNPRATGDDGRLGLVSVTASQLAVDGTLLTCTFPSAPSSPTPGVWCYPAAQLLDAASSSNRGTHPRHPLPAYHRKIPSAVVGGVPDYDLALYCLDQSASALCGTLSKARHTQATSNEGERVFRTVMDSMQRLCDSLHHYHFQNFAFAHERLWGCSDDANVVAAQLRWVSIPHAVCCACVPRHDATNVWCLQFEVSEQDGPQRTADGDGGDGTSTVLRLAVAMLPKVFQAFCWSGTSPLVRIPIVPCDPSGGCVPARPSAPPSGILKLVDVVSPWVRAGVELPPALHDLSIGVAAADRLHDHLRLMLFAASPGRGAIHRAARGDNTIAFVVRRNRVVYVVDTPQQLLSCCAKELVQVRGSRSSRSRASKPPHNA